MEFLFAIPVIIIVIYLAFALDQWVNKVELEREYLQRLIDKEIKKSGRL